MSNEEHAKEAHEFQKLHERYVHEVILEDKPMNFTEAEVAHFEAYSMQKDRLQIFISAEILKQLRILVKELSTRT